MCALRRAVEILARDGAYRAGGLRRLAVWLGLPLEDS